VRRPTWRPAWVWLGPCSTSPLNARRPTASLDPAAARDIRDRICEFAAQENVGVLWTSHNMYEVEKVCDRVLFLSRGCILLEGNPKTLPRQHGKETLEDLFIAVAREPLTLGGAAV
jgi:ABC-2 type transport system ATP-binding protein